MIYYITSPDPRIGPYTIHVKRRWWVSRKLKVIKSYAQAAELVKQLRKDKNK